MQISRLGFTGELGYELLLPIEATPRLWAALVQAGTPLGLRPAGGAALITARVEAGLIMGDLEYDETSTPWEYRMGWAVDLAKPDFQGKEAPSDSRAVAGRTIVSIAFPEGSDGLDGAELIVAGRGVGHVSMAAVSPVLQGRMLGLARIEWGFAVIGTELSAEGVVGEVVSMPVHDPERRRTRE
jgi:aminomethyltransferase